MIIRKGRTYLFLLVLGSLLSTDLSHANFHVLVPLVSSDPTLGAPMIDSTLRHAWGIAIRPPGSFGGHFWLSSYGNGTSNQYVGDVPGLPLFQDALVNMDVPPFTPGFSPPVPSGPETFIPDGLGISRPTGQTWQQTTGFLTTLEHLNGTIHAPAKFLFATEDGIISTWTDNRQFDGTPNWVGYSVAQIDRSLEGSAFFGITVSLHSGLAYVADLGRDPGLRVFAGDYSERTDLFGGLNPFVGSDGFQPGEYLPFGIRTTELNGAGNLLITYQKTLIDPADPGRIVPGLGEVGPGLGRLAEFDPDGLLVAIWNDMGMLNSPIDIAVAPDDFGEWNGSILIANAGDGTIVAFDPTSRTAIDYLRDPLGQVIVIDGLRGITFGNGFSLGEHNHLYFTAAPNGGADGLFGKLVAIPEPNAWILALLSLGPLLFTRARTELGRLMQLHWNKV